MKQIVIKGTVYTNWLFCFFGFHYLIPEMITSANEVKTLFRFWHCQTCRKMFFDKEFLSENEKGVEKW